MAPNVALPSPSDDIQRPAFLQAWRLTAAISPRSTVRALGRDAAGQLTDAYNLTVRTAHPAPDGPWAVCLTDRHGQYRLIGLDLDAHNGEVDQANRDCARVVSWCERLGIAYVACESGPSGGRHVWLALAAPVAASFVRQLGRHLRHCLPTLDLSPLSNPATGCLRPPLSPHRDGGVSSVMLGSLTALTDPSTTIDQLHQLDALAIESAPAGTQVPDLPDTTKPPTEGSDAQILAQLPRDRTGNPYLPGARRPRPAASVAAIEDDPASGDASRRLAIILTGLAAARWRYTDALELAQRHPDAFAHVWTQSGAGGRRHPRSEHSQHEILRRQWARAVAHAARSRSHQADRDAADDPDFARRAADIAAHVEAIQQHADTTPGRWAVGGGPVDRRVLDALCLIVLTAVDTCIDIDVRRLALLAGVGRTAAATALHRLAADNWLHRQAEAADSNSATWMLLPEPNIHSSSEDARTQGNPAAARADPTAIPAGPTDRAALRQELAQRLQLAAHDLFTGSRSLSHHAGMTYARLRQHAAIDRTNPATEKALLQLHAVGLITVTASAISCHSPERRDAIAHELGVDGRLVQRALTYAVERAVWQWWQAEYAWMLAPRRQRRPHINQPGLPQLGELTWPAYPRRRRRADHPAARAVCRSQLGSAAAA